MKNTDICKFRMAKQMGYSYKNSFVGFVEVLEEGYITIQLFVYVMPEIYLRIIDEKNSTRQIFSYAIAEMKYKDGRLKTHELFNNYPQIFFNEIKNGLKKLGTKNCKECVHFFQRNLTKNCPEEFKKNKCNEQHFKRKK